VQLDPLGTGVNARDDLEELADAEAKRKILAGVD
jgi:hypothetical protein